MDIEIHGLTSKQKALCDILWSFDSSELVNRFISTLPVADRKNCQLLVELMILAVADDVTDLSDAEQIIDKIAQR